eukprot:COSAG06_NODE_11596_length_1487_cov_1.398415_2_plen_119_part_00
MPVLVLLLLLRLLFVRGSWLLQRAGTTVATAHVPETNAIAPILAACLDRAKKTGRLAPPAEGSAPSLAYARTQQTSDLPTVPAPEIIAACCRTPCRCRRCYRRHSALNLLLCCAVLCV